MKRLLVVVDYQNDFVVGSLGFEKAKDLEQGIFEKIEEYLNNEDKVLITYDTHYEDYLNTREGKNLPSLIALKIVRDIAYGKINGFANAENILYYEKEGFGISPRI